MPVDMNSTNMVEVVSAIDSGEAILTDNLIKNKEGQILIISGLKTFTFVPLLKASSELTLRDTTRIEHAVATTAQILARKGQQAQLTHMMDINKNLANLDRNLEISGYRRAVPAVTGTNNCFFDSIAYHHNAMKNTGPQTLGTELRAVAHQYAIRHFSRATLDRMTKDFDLRPISPKQSSKYVYCNNLHEPSLDDARHNHNTRSQNTRYHEIIAETDSLGDMQDTILLTHHTQRPIVSIDARFLTATEQLKCQYVVLPDETRDIQVDHEHFYNTADNDQATPDHTEILALQDGKEGLNDVIAQLGQLGWPADQIITIIYTPGHWSPIEQIIQ
ncbi:MAG: hypothetical protein QS748_05900 [Candidatus Endonucleobacter bathymodioli]|uniref:Uncharacterized protein n=1 Tax=Candidatus Endonucleibacter bathymodioli TaxID=539814 RepID=A0AA90NQL9_9GAMM|nr:hypothetical protein [Candidatus Endonucleobacter bathymodioli]